MNVTQPAAMETVRVGARRCVALYLGRVGYREAAGFQEICARALKQAQLEPATAPPGRAASAEARVLERLLLLEHPPVITLGRNARADDILAGRESLQALGVEVEATNRGGQVTYHGPGQLCTAPMP